ncbi:hypothetical protein ACJJTC_018322 [Scirpophaga incertulas]
MTRDDVDLSRVHVGKRRPKYKHLSDMLDDKVVVKKRQDIYTKYSMVCDEESMYSDEYDDTYDSEGGAPSAPSGDAEGVRRPFVTPRVLRTARDELQEESDEESEPEEEQKVRSRVEFCVNPEEIRARRAAQPPPPRGGRGGAPPVYRNTNVTGKPKGQGQEKEVLHNRDRKEKHKSSRANHNRRQGAQWKRSQGMMPS